MIPGDDDALPGSVSGKGVVSGVETRGVEPLT